MADQGSRLLEMSFLDKVREFLDLPVSKRELARRLERIRADDIEIEMRELERRLAALTAALAAVGPACELEQKSPAKPKGTS
jgi:hypothetical protein